MENNNSLELENPFDIIEDDYDNWDDDYETMISNTKKSFGIMKHPIEEPTEEPAENIVEEPIEESIGEPIEELEEFNRVATNSDIDDEVKNKLQLELDKFKENKYQRSIAVKIDPDEFLNKLGADYVYKVRESGSIVMTTNKEGQETKKVIPYELARFLVDYFHIISDNIDSYFYNGLFYQKMDVADGDNNGKVITIYKLIEKTLRMIDSSLMKMNIIREVEGHIKGISLQEAVLQEPQTVNFKNGIYILNEDKLIKHTPNVITLGTINADYIPGASIKGTNFEHYLKTSLGDKIEVAQSVGEMIALAMIPLTDNNYHYIFCLVGGGRNGKSILLDTLGRAIPSCLRSSLPIEKLGTQFGTYQLKGKLTNICTDDSSSVISSSGEVKAISAGETVFCDIKGKQGLDVRMNCTIISAFNTLPKIVDKTDSIYDRLRILEFSRSFGTQRQVDNGEKDFVADKGLKNKLEKELSIICSWAISRLKVMLAKGDISETEQMKSFKSRYRSTNNNVLSWLDDNLIEVPEYSNGASGTYTLNVVYDNYRNWCANSGSLPMIRDDFKQELLRQSNKYTSKSGKPMICSIGSKKVKYYYHMELRAIEKAEKLY